MRHVLPLLLLLVPLSGRAASDPTLPDLSVPPRGLVRDGASDVALIMAVERYAALPAVPGARANAEDWDAYLRARGVGTVKLLTDNDVTPGNVREVLPKVLAERRAGGRVWIVFIGHGGPGPDDEGALVGWATQGNPQSLRDDSIAQTTLLDAVGPGIPVTLVVDACFAGRTASGDLLPGYQPVRGVDPSLDVSSAATLMVAAKGDEYAGALPGVERPAFSWLVLGALRGWGDTSGDGAVTATEAVNWTRKRLLEVVSNPQTPEVSGVVDVVVAHGREAAPDLRGILGTGAPRLVESNEPAKIVDATQVSKHRGRAGFLASTLVAAGAGAALLGVGGALEIGYQADADAGGMPADEATARARAIDVLYGSGYAGLGLGLGLGVVTLTRTVDQTTPVFGVVIPW